MFPQTCEITDYETFIASGDPDYAWAMPPDEWDAISLNYTSGTTGNPKGVVYHHRGAYLLATGNVLHTTSNAKAGCAFRTRGQVVSVTRCPCARQRSRSRSEAPCAVTITSGRTNAAEHEPGRPTFSIRPAAEIVPSSR